MGLPPHSSKTPASLTAFGRLVWHKGLLAAGAILAASAMTVYVLWIEALSIWLGWGVYLTGRGLLQAQSIGLQDGFRVACLAAGAWGWMVMMRPLFPKPWPETTAIEVTASTQPELLLMVAGVCRRLRMDPPVQVLLDCSVEARAALQGGLTGLRQRRTTLTIGLPVIATLDAHELEALLAAKLTPCRGAVASRLWHLAVELHDSWHRAWFGRSRSDAERLVEAPDDRSLAATAIAKMRRMIERLFLVPFGLACAAASLAGWIATLSGRGMEKGALRADLGRRGWMDLEKKLRCLAAARDRIRDEMRDDLEHGKVTASYPLLVWMRGLESRRQREMKETGEAEESANSSFSGKDEAAWLVRQFVELARQASALHCQHDLGLAIHELTKTAAAEETWQKRRQAEALVAIRRSFRGLLHPERSMGGIGATYSAFPGQQQLAADIARCRQFEKQHGRPMAAALKDWDLAWHHRRELEAAWVLSLAGYAVCRLDFGVEKSAAEVFRREAVNQKRIMEHLDEPLRICEAWIERRTAAALGLLWWSEPGSLSPALADLRAQLPAWAALHDALSSVMPEFCELLTNLHTFQTLASRYEGRGINGPYATAVQSIVPGMIQRAGGIIRALDGAPSPFTIEGREVSLAVYLSPYTGGRIEFNPAAAGGMHAMAEKMSADAAGIIGPFTERLHGLYHQSLAWLGGAAAVTERFFEQLIRATDVSACRTPEAKKTMLARP